MNTPTKEYIYDLQLQVKDPDVPFTSKRSIGVQSGDLVEVFSKFLLEFSRLMREMVDEERREQGIDDDIPF